MRGFIHRESGLTEINQTSGSSLDIWAFWCQIPAERKNGCTTCGKYVVLPEGKTLKITILASVDNKDPKLDDARRHYRFGFVWLSSSGTDIVKRHIQSWQMQPDSDISFMLELVKSFQRSLIRTSQILAIYQYQGKNPIECMINNFSGGNNKFSLFLYFLSNNTGHGLNESGYQYQPKIMISFEKMICL